MSKAMIKKIILAASILFLSSAFCLFADGENLTLKIAVIGPGDELYFWWGHIALVIEDSDTGRGRFYDYGIFSFDNENFFLNFAFGRLIYCCGASPVANNIKIYENTNRDITLYTLDVLPEKRIEVRDFAQRNILPENRDYSYHHFEDNCSNRIRDIIDIVTDGQFSQEHKKTPGRYTLRQHVRRHTWFNPPVDWALNFWMGQVIDTPITTWDEMFLPSEVGRNIEDFWYTDAKGARRKLVASVETVFKSKGRPVVLDVPRAQWPRELLFSVLLSALFYFFFFLQEKGYHAGKILAGTALSVSGFILGIASLMLYFLNIFTNHDYTYQNYNMLFATPLIIACFPLGICYAAAKDKNKLFRYNVITRLIWLITLLGIFISMAINLFPAFFQKNLTDKALFLPLALVFTFHQAGLKEIKNRLSLISRKGKEK